MKYYPIYIETRPKSLLLSPFLIGILEKFQMLHVQEVCKGILLYHNLVI